MQSKKKIDSSIRTSPRGRNYELDSQLNNPCQITPATPRSFDSNVSDKTLSCESPNQTIALTGGQYKDFKITGSGSSANNCEIQLSGVFNIAGDFDISITNSSTQVVATDAVFFYESRQISSC